MYNIASLYWVGGVGEVDAGDKVPVLPMGLPIMADGGTLAGDEWPPATGYCPMEMTEPTRCLP